MWVFTETGFVSAVVDLKDSDQMIVRSRDRKSLEPLSEMADVAILSTPERDYPFRVFVTKFDFTNWMVDSIDEMTYNNYKSRMSVTRGREYVGALHDVWEVMHKVSPRRAGGMYDRYGYDDVWSAVPTRSERRRQWWEDLANEPRDNMGDRLEDDVDDPFPPNNLYPVPHGPKQGDGKRKRKRNKRGQHYTNTRGRNR
jgi:hypothetical protein